MGYALDGWAVRLHEKADFRASFAELRGVQGYRAEVFRARCQSLQGKIFAAARGFDRAAVKSSEDPKQAIIADAYARENALLIGRPRPPATPREILGQADARLARLHRTLDAAEDLQAGRNREAADFLIRAIHHDRADTGPEQRAMWRLLLASALANLGAIRSALKSLEIAGLYVLQPTDRLLGQVRLSARLGQVYTFLDCPALARDWWLYHDRVPCPDATKEAMRWRAARLLRRSVRLGRCVLC